MFRARWVQLLNLAFILLRRSPQFAALGVYSKSGMPRYLVGREFLWILRILLRFLYTGIEVLKKNNLDFVRLISIPEASMKVLSTVLKVRASFTVGVPISIVSSTNCWCVTWVLDAQLWCLWADSFGPLGKEIFWGPLPWWQREKVTKDLLAICL